MRRDADGATRRRVTLWISIALLVAAGCATRAAAEPPRRLGHADAWFGDNHARLQRMIDAHGTASAGYDPARPPVAVLDWDNTMVKNDIGQATLFWMLEHNRIHMPQSGEWKDLSPFFTRQALDALNSYCRLAPRGSPLPTRAEDRCADELLSIAHRGRTTAGQPAFEGWNHDYMKPTAALMAIVHGGRTPEESRADARAAIDEALAAPVGATRIVGTTVVPAWVRIYEPMEDLARTLDANGFEVWVVSASPQTVVEVLAERVGIPAERVIGIRNGVKPDTGMLDALLQGCGPIGDGQNRIITYGLGKRCWINRIILGIDDYRVQLDPAPSDRRPVFAAGDSSTDRSFLADATDLRLVINRNDPQLMCPAYAGLGEGWIVNPMFIEPLPKRAEPYPCSTTACRSAEGEPRPCTDAAGEPIPDQEDTVFVAPSVVEGVEEGE